MQHQQQSGVLPDVSAWSGIMEGSLLKHNTSHGGSEYSRRVHCVLMGYTLFEYDSEADAKPGLWPRAEADVIGVSPAPSSVGMRSALSITSSSKDAALTFVYTTTAGERVCAVAATSRECERWIVALTLGVELLLLSGLQEGAGGASTEDPHAAPPADTAATHCSATGAQFGYTVTRLHCAASGRAFCAAAMAPTGLPLPGIGLSHAARVSEACGQAQQLLNVARCRARFLAAAAHAEELEVILERKARLDKPEMWLLLGQEARGLTSSIASDEQQWTVDRYIASRDAARQSAALVYEHYRTSVLEVIEGDLAELVAELHFLGVSAPDADKDDKEESSSSRSSSLSSSSVLITDREAALQTIAESTAEKATASPYIQSKKITQEDSEDAAKAQHRVELRALLSTPSHASAHAAAVRDVLSALLSHTAADDDKEACCSPRTLFFEEEQQVKGSPRRNRRDLLFYLPQLAHVYYRQLPPRSAQAAVRVTLLEEFLLRLARRSFKFALRLAWTLVAYLEDRDAIPRRRPHALRLLIELEAAAATQHDNNNMEDGDPWALRKEAVAAAAMARRGPLPGELSPFAGAVALELLPRAPPWIALELRRAASNLRRAAAQALKVMGVEALASGGPRPLLLRKQQQGLENVGLPPDDVLAREMRFVRAMCDVAEAMRSVELSQRPARLRRELEALPRLTPLGHSPIGATLVNGELLSQTVGGPQPSCRVVRVPPTEGHVFKTKARAPTLMLLETVDDSPIIDFADDSTHHRGDTDDDEEILTRAASTAAAAAATEEEVGVTARDLDAPDDDLVPPALTIEIEDDEAGRRRREEMQGFIAPILDEEPPSFPKEEEEEEETALSPNMARREIAMRARACDDLLLSPRASKRVQSVPSIIDSAYAAELIEVAVEEATPTKKSYMSTSKLAAATPPPRRVASAGALGALPETTTPTKAPPPSPRRTIVQSQSEQNLAAQLAAEPVAKGSAVRAEVVRALRKKATLGLKLDRFVSELSPERSSQDDDDLPAPADTQGSSTATTPEEEEEENGSSSASSSAANEAAADEPAPPPPPVSPIEEEEEEEEAPPSSDKSSSRKATKQKKSTLKSKRRPGFGEPWAAQRERIRRSSPVGGEPSWKLVSCIVKSNDDLRQEVCALQIVAACMDAFEASGLAGDSSGLWLRHYCIVPTGASTGIVETLSDAVSLDALKKSQGYTTLAAHLQQAHEGAVQHAKARKAFISSMAAYSLVCHLLGLKDRHNGNILVDSHGHVVHIDFGFMLGQAPGGSFSLERVPFKLTAEMVEAMGGWASDGFSDFVILLACGFMALQKHHAKILAIVQVMARDSPFPCFRQNPTAVIERMRSRLKLGLTGSKEQVANHVTDLVRQSYNAYGTRQYDSFQYLTNGIYI